MEIQSTDLEDFWLIYNANYTLLMQVSVHIVYDQCAAEDLTQEAFERFYVKNMKFPSEDDARYWLLRVVKNLSLNYIKRKEREARMTEKLKEEDAGVGKEDASAGLVQEDEKERVRAAIESLPENLKSVIKLKEYTDLDYKGISKVLGISVANVKVRVFRARKKLEEILREDEDVY